MENSISTGTNLSWKNERERQQLRFSTCPFGWGDRSTTISDDYVNGERGIDERDDAALYDSLPGRQRDNVVEPAEQYRSTAPCFFVPYRNNPANAFCLA